MVDVRVSLRVSLRVTCAWLVRDWCVSCVCLPGAQGASTLGLNVTINPPTISTRMITTSKVFPVLS